MAIFGDNTIESLDDGGNATGYIFGCRFQAPANGTLTDISIYVLSGAGNIAVAVYSDVSGIMTSLLASGPAGAVAGTPNWFDFSGFSLPITAGLYYWLAWQTDSDSIHFAYNTSAFGQYTANTPYTYPTFPNLWDNTAAAYVFSIYATYTPSGAAANPEITWAIVQTRG